MGERVNKVKEMIEEHEASFESLKESTKQYDEQINQYVVESNQRKLHIERLEEEKDTYAKDDRILLEEYNKSIEQAEKEQEETAKQKEELEEKKRKLEKDVEKEMQSFTRHDSILKQLTQEGMQIDTEISKIKLDMQANLYKQQTFKLEYDQDGNAINGMEFAKLDKEYKDLTDQLNELKEAKALCQEYIQKYHDELDNDAKKKWASVQETLTPEPTKPEPAKPEPTKPEPTKPEPAKPELTKPEPAKPEPAKPEPTKPEPAKPEPAKPEPAKPGKATNIRDYSEKLYDKMTPKLRNEIFMYATGQTKEPSENAKLIFDELQKRYGTDVASKIENNVKQMSAKEFLKVTEIKTDVTTGLITIDFNCGEKFKPVIVDLREYGNKGIRMESVKNTQKLASKFEFDEEIADPYVIRALERATNKQLEKLGLDKEQIGETDIQKQIDIYEEALETSRDENPEDKKLDINISYEKSNKENPVKAGRKKFEKALRPFLREAQDSAYVEIDDSIDIRTGLEKIKDALSMPWKWLTGKIKPLPAGGKYLKEDDKSKDDELTKVARGLGIEAQMNIVKNRPTGEIDEDLTPEQEEKLNNMLREDAEKRSMKPEASAKFESRPKTERDDDDEWEK